MSFRDLLETAYRLGRADGFVAADLEPAEGFDATSSWCRGRSPWDFANELWGDRPGSPPSGLEVNAPLWYSTGFREAVAEVRAEFREAVAEVRAEFREAAAEVRAARRPPGQRRPGSLRPACPAAHPADEAVQRRVPLR